jgi:multiple sugar transport system permease protein
MSASHYRTARPARRDERASGWAIRGALVLVALFFGAPFIWVVAAAFDAEAGGYLPWPGAPTLANYADLFRELEFGRALRTSLIVSGVGALVTTMAAALAGYAFSRLNWRGSAGLASGMLLLQTMPLIATMVPIYDLARRFELRNTYLGLILVHAALALPLLIWLMKGFFDGVPRLLEEAAWLDGASRLRAWREILLPLVRPGLAVAVGLSFLTAWSEVLLALVMVDAGSGKETVALAFFRATERVGGLSTEGYELVAAMGVLYVAPVLALFLVAGRLAVGGLSGGVHGE